jgi:prolyl 4-hydroxylase
MDLNEYIQVYDYTLSDDVCKHLIRVFNEQDVETLDNNGRPKFQQFNITQWLDDNTEHHDDWKDIGILHNALIESSHYWVQKYMDDVDCRMWFPLRSELEQFRVKKYTAGTDDRFDIHVDVGDHPSAKRFLSIFWYLNNVSEGGETIFKDGPTIKPKAGRMVVFPPLWVFPHEGRPTISNDKYLVSTYTHYV